MKTFYLDINVAGKFEFLETRASSMHDAIAIGLAYCRGRGEFTGTPAAPDIAKVSQTKTRGQEYVRI